MSNLLDILSQVRGCSNEDDISLLKLLHSESTSAHKQDTSSHCRDTNNCKLSEQSNRCATAARWQSETAEQKVKLELDKWSAEGNPMRKQLLSSWLGSPKSYWLVSPIGYSATARERKAVLLLLSAQRWSNLLLVLEIWCLFSLLKMWLLTITSCALAWRAGLLVKVRLGASDHGPTERLHLKSVKEGYLLGSFNLVKSQISGLVTGVYSLIAIPPNQTIPYWRGTH